MVSHPESHSHPHSQRLQLHCQLPFSQVNQPAWAWAGTAVRTIHTIKKVPICFFIEICSSGGLLGADTKAGSMPSKGWETPSKIRYLGCRLSVQNGVLKNSGWNRKNLADGDLNWLCILEKLGRLCRTDREIPSPGGIEQEKESHPNSFGRGTRSFFETFTTLTRLTANTGAPCSHPQT